MSTKPIPEEFHAITPYLFAQGASRLIEFISAAFEGEVIFRQNRPDGTIMHATYPTGRNDAGKNSKCHK
jgi:PhnB protein